MFKTKKIHAYILLGLFIILIAGMWIVTNLKYRVIIKDNIFIEIKDLLWDKEKEILEFQNPLSLHITVYYLPWKTTEIENKKIKDLIDTISQQKIKISMKKLEYFWDKIAYISYDDFENLEKINKFHSGQIE